MGTILVVDDEPDMRWLLARVLQGEGLGVVTAEDGQAAVDQLRKDAPSAIILDLRMPRLGGMEALGKIREIDSQIPVIMLSGYGDIPTAVQAMKLGAADFLTKPFDNGEILCTVRRILASREPVVLAEGLGGQPGEDDLQGLMGTSPPIQKVFQQVQVVARTAFTVLIQGETGTGKEIIARAIHQQSARHEDPFVALDCGAIPETLIESELFGYEKGAFTGADGRKAGHFQLADGGSLFLDEIANLPLTTQSTLLRALEARRVRPLGGKRALPVDVRIIAASNVPLEAEIRASRFRPDLYYRLSEYTITLPPLRARRDDILHLAERFLEEVSIELRRPVPRLSMEAADCLLRHPWPGNVRELRNIIRQAVLLSTGLITLEHLSPLSPRLPAAPFGEPSPGQAGLSLQEISERVTSAAEQEAIRQALQTTRGNKSQAARLLKVDYKTLHGKMKRYGIRASEFLS